MRSVRLYDPERNPEHWSGLIQRGQFAVSHFDYETGTWRTAAGDYANVPADEVILLFDSLAQAKSYCQAHVERLQESFCRIYDHRGSAEGLVLEVFPPKIAERDFGPRLLAAKSPTAWSSFQRAYSALQWIGVGEDR